MEWFSFLEECSDLVNFKTLEYQLLTPATFNDMQRYVMDACFGKNPTRVLAEDTAKALCAQGDNGIIEGLKRISKLRTEQDRALSTLRLIAADSPTLSRKITALLDNILP